ncbi:MAG: peptidoglycan-binding protein, partial [Pseudomonadota bacterium]
LVVAALKSQDEAALRSLRSKAADHPRFAEIEAALDVHRRADDAVASLDFEALDILYQETSERHPRRAELRSAIRRAIVSDACAQMLRYRTICPPQVMALAQGAPTEVAVAADPPPEPAPAATPEPEPVDPTAVFIEDADDESLAKSAAVKVEWRQVALRALGYYQGAIDGAFGPGMSRAVDRWRSDMGIEVRGDLTPPEVVALMKQGAERNAKARAYLGVMYGIGLGVTLDPAKAEKHLTSADRAGDEDAGVYLKNLSANWN